MITSKDINDIIGITESFQLPEKLMAILLSEDKNSMFERFMNLEADLSFDWFTDYFQEQHSNRSAMMQDFTPRELTALLPMLSNNYSRVLDICAGTGGLSIGAWNKNHDAYFVCEELSERALPLLIFNMAIRNVNGYVINKNVLSDEVFGIYKLISSDKYSDIIKVDVVSEDANFDLIITNPPYSLRYEWGEIPAYLSDFGDPPTKAADYAFVLYGLSRMAENGMLCAILPHGVLFRGQKEGIIRQNLIEKNKISSVIGLPDKLFLNTCIPVCILVIQHDNRDVFFIDASREYQKEAKQNRLRGEDLNKISNAFIGRSNIDKYSRNVPYTEIEYNEYNLNIPRYVDTFEAEPLPDINKIVESLTDTKRSIRKTELELAKSLGEMCAINEEDAKIISKYIKLLKRGDVETYEQLTFDF